jgi:hypothetical protein
MRVEQPQLLVAMNRVECVVDVERDPFPKTGQFDNGVPIVEALMSCPAYWGTVYVWLVAARATNQETLLSLHKDDVLTVRGDVLRFGIDGDGDPYAKIMTDMICAWHHMPDEAESADIKRVQH